MLISKREGVKHFPGGGGGAAFSRGGVQLFSRGVQLLASMKIYRTCNFLVGSEPPAPRPSGSAHDLNSDGD